jgi:hypothetical protein
VFTLPFSLAPIADPDPAPDFVTYNDTVDDLFGDGNIFTNEVDTPTQTESDNNQENSWDYTPDPTPAPSPAPDFVTGGGAEASAPSAGNTSDVNSDSDSTCFVAGTEITMADGSNKLIEDVQIGDELFGRNNVINKVIEFDHPLLGNRKLYGFNGKSAFVTEEHPFLTPTGWKAININATIKEQPALDGEMIGNLKVGDEILMHDGLKTVISSIEEYNDEPNRQLYNFKLDGNNTYVANELIVHNKGGGGGGSKIVCTEMYRQTQLDDWSRAIKIWDIYQRRYLSPQHEIGYHWLFKPYVKGMRKSSILTKLGAELASRRTQHLKHILTKGKAKDSLIGKIWCSIIHPIVGTVGRVLSLLNTVRGN